MSNEHPPHHVPVLLDSVLSLLSPKAGESYLDLTAGYGGHAGAIIEKTKNYKDSMLVDRDDYAISHLSSFEQHGTRLMHSDFVAAAQALVQEKKTFDIILIDLGVSSPQLDQGERGFSFKRNGPLDMRMDRSTGITAAELIDNSTISELATIIHEFGDEPYGLARKLAEVIVTNRPFTDTESLAELIKQHHRGRRSRIHPATRTFQALRIAVNDELGQVKTLLPLIPRLLHTGGRVGVISFHSLEDRLVKQYLKDQRDAGFEAELTVITKKPVDGATSDVHNPRSRSAKLRVAVKK
ncbi:16S rRNA (cytosine(1402)-N(4))-methyltransferase RsmH [Candidatus Saccharibacteria bacterium]|nr:16S rRNA (cytosine(1402)-N(4))-methyltransferase RsmH [Candidatus Saccharibacteria bacterium]